MFRFLSALVVLQFGCIPDKDAPCRNTVVADSLVLPNNIAYGNADTLLFTNLDYSDSIWLLTRSNSEYGFLVRGNTPNNPDCPNDYLAYLKRKVVLADSISNFTLTVEASRYTDSAVWTFAGNTLRLSVNAIGKRDSTFADSVLLGTQQYYKVNTVKGEDGKLFYLSSTQGLLQFEWQQQQFYLRD